MNRLLAALLMRLREERIFVGEAINAGSVIKDRESVKTELREYMVKSEETKVQLEQKIEELKMKLADQQNKYKASSTFKFFLDLDLIFIFREHAVCFLLCPFQLIGKSVYSIQELEWVQRKLNEQRRNVTNAFDHDYAVLRQKVDDSDRKLEAREDKIQVSIDKYCARFWKQLAVQRILEYRPQSTTLSIWSRQ